MLFKQTSTTTKTYRFTDDDDDDDNDADALKDGCLQRLHSNITPVDFSRDAMLLRSLVAAYNDVG